MIAKYGGSVFNMFALGGILMWTFINSGLFFDHSSRLDVNKYLFLYGGTWTIGMVVLIFAWWYVRISILTRKSAEKYAREAEMIAMQNKRQFQTVVESSFDPIIMISDAGIITIFNEASEKFFDCDALEVIGKKIGVLFSGDLAETINSAISCEHISDSSTKENCTFRIDMENYQGKIVSVDFVVTFLSETSSDKFVSIVLHEVPVEAANNKNEDELSLLVTAVEQAQESFLITDSKGNILFVNQAFLNTTGYSSREVIGKNPRVIKSEKHDKGFYNDVWKTLSSGQPWSGNFINRKKDGTLFHVKATISPIRNDAGEITHFVAVETDVSKEIELEKQLRLSQKMEAIGTLAGGIAHDFNNLLFAMLGYAEMMKEDTPKDHPDYENLQQIITAGNRAKDLVRQILLFSRRSEDDPKPLSLLLILKEAAKLARSTIPKRIRITENYDEKVGKILADPSQVHQTIMNLLLNASGAITKNGQITISVDEVHPEKSFLDLHEMRMGKYLRLSIEDTGEGIKPEDLEKVFDPFFTTKADGTGIGLSVVHGIVKKAGGAILAESEVGKSSKFEVFFPVIEGMNTVQEENTDKFYSGTGNILLVDDEVALIKLMERVLVRAGYNVTISDSSQEALDLFTASPDAFDCLISDVNMPEINGWKLSSEVRKIKPALRTVIISGQSDEHTPGNIKKFGINTFVLKPISKNPFSKVVHDVFQMSVQNG